MKHTSHTRAVRFFSGLFYFFSIFMLIALLLPGQLHSQWIPQSIPVNKPITALEFTDSLNGWALTGWGPEQDTCYILRTSNEGNNWLVQQKFYNYTFYSMDMVDSMVGYASGVGGGGGFTLLLKTTNGGLNWIDLNMPTLGVGLIDIFFVNRDSGYVCSDVFVSFGVWRTTNGGANWERKVNGLNQFPYKLFFINFSTGYCGGDFTLFKTINSGDNWFAINGFSAIIKSIFFLNENSGWVGLANSRLAHTTNGGLNWSYQLPNFTVGSTTDLYFYDSLKGWGGNRNLKIIKTTTGGSVWGFQVTSSASFTISFLDSLRGWTGDIGISRTTNGGGIITHINSYTNFIPEDYILYQNYPNPFNSQAKISFEVKSNSFVKLIIYDIAGREINIWQSNGILLSGRHEFLFDAKGLSSGVYFYKLEARTQDGVVVFSKSKKMILSK
jgi:photosystem II stability/assembly factor-like uncharacterized protein